MNVIAKTYPNAHTVYIFVAPIPASKQERTKPFGEHRQPIPCGKTEAFWMSGQGWPNTSMPKLIENACNH